MSRWQPDAGARLQRAAFELFTQQGFAETTVPQITERAGLTTRTFFRHFADKREVLFGFVEGLPEFVEKVMTDAPASLPVMDVVGWGLDVVISERLKEQRDFLRMHRTIVQGDDGLIERESKKDAVIEKATRTAFIARGLDELDATVAAQLAMTVYTVSITRWLDDESGTDLSTIMHDTLRLVRKLAAE